METMTVQAVYKKGVLKPVKELNLFRERPRILLPAPRIQACGRNFYLDKTSKNRRIGAIKP